MKTKDEDQANGEREKHFGLKIKYALRVCVSVVKKLGRE